MASPVDVMECVKDAMKPESTIQDRLECVSNLRVIALALGDEKTRTQLLPFLKEQCDHKEIVVGDDEVLTGVAEVLGCFEDFVGGLQYAHCLLDPLLALCTVDETMVRSQAVDAIVALAKKLRPAQIFEFLAPKVLQLFNLSADPFTLMLARVSACGLVATAYTGCKNCGKDLREGPAKDTVRAGDKETSYTPDKLGKELVDAYKLQYNADEPMVRRSAALRLGDVAIALGDGADLVQQFDTLIDEYNQESIKVIALKSAHIFFRAFSPLDFLHTDGTVARYVACAGDKSWRVRVAVSESLPHVMKAVTDSRKGNGGEMQEGLRMCQEIFLSLLDDNEAEVRHATAVQSAAAASVEDAHFPAFQLLLAKAVEGMVLDKSVAKRTDLAGVLLEMATPIGMPKTKDVFLKPRLSSEGEGGANGTTLLADLVNDPDTKLEVISKLMGLIDVLTISQASEVIKIISALLTDKSWRVRHAAMQLLPYLAPQMSPDAFNKSFELDSHALKFSQDETARIPQDWIVCCKAIADCPGYGSEWLKAHIVPVLQLRLLPKKKLVYLHAMNELSGLFGAQAMAEDFLPHILTMFNDCVPNVRMRCAETLGKIAYNGDVGKPCVDEQIKPALQKLAKDLGPTSGFEDVDVKSFAKAAMKKMGWPEA